MFITNNVLNHCILKRKTSLKRNQQVIPLGSGWAVKTEGDGNFSIITDRKSEAIFFAKKVSKNHGVNIIVYSKDGSIIRKY